MNWPYHNISNDPISVLMYSKNQINSNNYLMLMNMLPNMINLSLDVKDLKNETEKNRKIKSRYSRH